MKDTEGSSRRLRSVIIVGGGTSGWMAAAALARVLAGSSCAITLVESEAIEGAGVEEATLPSLVAFHHLLGFNERDFLRATQATFKLAIQFRDWRKVGESFLHPFGPYGLDIPDILFQAYWLKRRQQGRAAPLEEWSVTGLAASLGRFGQAPSQGDSAFRHFSYAYHLDALLYGRFLRTYAEQRGVLRIEGTVADVAINPGGLIDSVRLRDGRVLSADFFIDCSGFQALLIEGALQSGYLDWSHWLACDRAVAVECERVGALPPLTQSIARESGWQWRIPLQHRMSNGYVYSSAHLSEDEAAARLVEGLEGVPLADPRPLRFRAGRRKQAWVGNCLALGLSAGCLEPLESTSIHLVQTGLGRLFTLFPDRDFDPAIRAEYNRLTASEHEHVRDFLILHYAASQRDDTPFWRHCRATQVPDTLTYKRELFTRTGRIAVLEDETFLSSSWLAIYAGLHVWPQRYEPAIDLLASADAEARFEGMRPMIRRWVEALPAHATFLQEIVTARTRMPEHE